jgi:2-polyprenyl-3-methyl-5-hydroxy-6-metoxy-1,4-benzoquinol methylase
MLKNIKSQWESPVCNFCGRKPNKVILNNVDTWINSGKYRLVKCNNCNLIYLSPRPKKAYISRYYPPETYWGTGVVESTKKEDIKLRENTFGYLYKDILKKKSRGNILDLGAGTGSFLSKFKKPGWKLSGVELSKETCDYAKRAYGIKILQGSFPEINLPYNTYDVITLNGCLEHVYKPKESLAKILKLLKAGGFVEITVPNFSSLGRNIFGRRWYALQPPSHLYHYTPVTITRVLKEIGFKNIEIKHNYWNHNFYILFESMRLAFSPKFKNENIGNFIDTQPVIKNKKFSVKMETGKIIAKITAYTLAHMEPALKRGEVITIYAEKN